MQFLYTDSVFAWMIMCMNVIGYEFDSLSPDFLSITEDILLKHNRRKAGD